MKQTTAEDFALFKAEFRYWINRFGLNGWQIYFNREYLQGQYSQVALCAEYHVATVSLCEDYDELQGEIDIPHIAKHEATHVLIGDLSEASESRWVTQHELNAIQEELVNRLMTIVQR